MKLEEFEIGGFFWTGSGKWMCFDKGNKAVIATRYRPTVLIHSTGNPFECERHEKISPETHAEYWTGDQYRLDHTIFFQYDFDGCWKTEKEYNDILEIKAN